MDVAGIGISCLHCDQILVWLRPAPAAVEEIREDDVGDAVLQLFRVAEGVAAMKLAGTLCPYCGAPPRERPEPELTPEEEAEIEVDLHELAAEMNALEDALDELDLGRKEDKGAG